MSRPSKLPTHPRELVLTALRRSRRPLTAYNLLEKLAPHGVKGPPVVYRALEALMKSGAVHRIRALNAFVACNCASDHAHTLSVLTVCTGCEQVEERHDHALIQHLAKLRRMNVALPEQAVIELPVLCDGCAAA